MAKAAVKGARTRARTSSGHYKADDPATPDVNEAFVQGASISVGGVETTAAPKKPRKARAKKAEQPKRTRTVNEFGEIVKL
jgi:hypothetical protein